MGIAKFPNCAGTNFMCKLLNKYLKGDVVYTPIAQNLLTQTNFVRDQ